MRSGRLWSDAGRQVRSMAGRPARRVSSTSSTASAPQPITRGGREVGDLGADSRTSLFHERLRRLDRDRGVAAVGIGADRLAELLVEWGPADEDDVVVANAPLRQLADDDLH